MITDALPPIVADLCLSMASFNEGDPEPVTDTSPDARLADFWRTVAGEGPEGWTTEQLAGVPLDALRKIARQLRRLYELASDHEDVAAAGAIAGIGLRVEEWLVLSHPEYAAEARFRAAADERGELDGEAN